MGVLTDLRGEGENPPQGYPKFKGQLLATCFRDPQAPYGSDQPQGGFPTISSGSIICQNDSRNSGEHCPLWSRFSPKHPPRDRTREVHALSLWNQRWCPPSTSRMCWATRKLYGPEFLLGFHYRNMTDWTDFSPSSMPRKSKDISKSQQSHQLGWPFLWPAPILKLSRDCVCKFINIKKTLFINWGSSRI